MQVKIKCPCCNCDDFFILNDKDNNDFYCLISGNMNIKELNYSDILPLNVYECKNCKNLIFKTYQN